MFLVNRAFDGLRKEESKNHKMSFKHNLEVNKHWRMVHRSIKR